MNAQIALNCKCHSNFKVCASLSFHIYLYNQVCVDVNVHICFIPYARHSSINIDFIKRIHIYIYILVDLGSIPSIKHVLLKRRNRENLLSHLMSFSWCWISHLISGGHLLRNLPKLYVNHNWSFSRKEIISPEIAIGAFMLLINKILKWT